MVIDWSGERTSVCDVHVVIRRAAITPFEHLQIESAFAIDQVRECPLFATVFAAAMQLNMEFVPFRT